MNKSKNVEWSNETANINNRDERREKGNGNDIREEIKKIMEMKNRDEDESNEKYKEIMEDQGEWETERGR